MFVSFLASFGYFDQVIEVFHDCLPFLRGSVRVKSLGVFKYMCRLFFPCCFSRLELESPIKAYQFKRCSLKT